MSKWWIVPLLACLALPVGAQEEDLSTLPGYVDFGALNDIYGEPRVMIDISGFLLQIMSAAAQSGEPETAELMRNLDGIRVNVYSTAGQIDPALEQINKVKGVLQNLAWQPVVQVRESNEHVQIFMKAGEEGMEGLAVMTVDAEEAVFINILGQIDPAQLNTVMRQLNVDVETGED